VYPKNSLCLMSLRIDEVEPDPTHHRIHSNKKISRLKKSILAYGQLPIFIDQHNKIIDGHAVWRAMRELGKDSIIAYSANNLSNDEVKAIRLAIPQFQRQTKNDLEKLKQQFAVLGELKFEFKSIGLNTPKIKSLNDFASLAVCGAQAPVSCPGDIWRCNSHLVACGTFQNRSLTKELMADGPTDLALHNLSLDSLIQTTTNISDPLSLPRIREANRTYLSKLLDDLSGLSGENGALCITADWRNLADLILAARSINLDVIDIWIWNKATTRELIKAHQHLCFFGTPACRTLKKSATNRKDVWTPRGAPNIPALPAGKRAAVFAELFRTTVKAGGAILDTSVGSGEALLAAEKCKIRLAGFEPNPLVLDLAIRRWQMLSQSTALNARTGQPFGTRDPVVSDEGQANVR
jgi:hypothetical protein